jgi:hypothetical protein
MAGYTDPATGLAFDRLAPASDGAMLPIFVAASASTASRLTNSPVTGNWEDATPTIPVVDASSAPWPSAVVRHRRPF